MSPLSGLSAHQNWTEQQNACTPTAPYWLFSPQQDIHVYSPSFWGFCKVTATERTAVIHFTTASELLQLNTCGLGDLPTLCLLCPPSLCVPAPPLHSSWTLLRLPAWSQSRTHSRTGSSLWEKQGVDCKKRKKFHTKGRKWFFRLQRELVCC